MKTYTIPCHWTMYGWLKIEAENISEAVKQAYDVSNPNGEYVDNSFEVDVEVLDEHNELTEAEMEQAKKA